MLVFEYLEEFHNTKLVKISFFYKPGNGGGGGGMYSASGKSKTQAYSVMATSGLVHNTALESARIVRV